MLVHSPIGGAVYDDVRGQNRGHLDATKCEKKTEYTHIEHVCVHISKNKSPHKNTYAVASVHDPRYKIYVYKDHCKNVYNAKSNINTETSMPKSKYTNQQTNHNVKALTGYTSA